MNTINRPVSLATPIVYIVFLVVMVIVYGFLTQFYREIIYYWTNDGKFVTLEVPNKAVAHTCLLIMDTVFTLLGFGLLLSIFRNQKWAGMTIALFVVAFNIIAGLLAQKLMFEIFFGFRKNLTNGDDGYVNAPNAYEFWNRQSMTGKALSSYYSFRLSNLCSTSFLVGMTAFNGRVTFSNIAFALPLFCVLYYLNFYINALASYSVQNKASSFGYLDAYGTILVYLFGGIYGFIAAALNRSPK